MEYLIEEFGSICSALIFVTPMIVIFTTILANVTV